MPRSSEETAGRDGEKFARRKEHRHPDRLSSGPGSPDGEPGRMFTNSDSPARDLGLMCIDSDLARDGPRSHVHQLRRARQGPRSRVHQLRRAREGPRSRVRRLRFTARDLGRMLANDPARHVPAVSGQEGRAIAQATTILCQEGRAIAQMTAIPGQEARANAQRAWICGPFPKTMRTRTPLTMIHACPFQWTLQVTSPGACMDARVDRAGRSGLEAPRSIDKARRLG